MRYSERAAAVKGVWAPLGALWVARRPKRRPWATPPRRPAAVLTGPHRCSGPPRAAWVPSAGPAGGGAKASRTKSVAVSRCPLPEPLPSGLLGQVAWAAFPAGGFYREVRIPNLPKGLHLGGAS